MSGDLILQKIIAKIYIIRGKKVMLDKDLAELYAVEAKRLNEQVKRNIKRFPVDFMMQLTREELKDLRSQFATANISSKSRSLPYVFTENGVAMLSTVLNSEKAIQVNIQIMRVFTKLREMMLTQGDIVQRLKEVEKKLEEHDQAFYDVFYQIKQILIQEEKPKRRIGFNVGEGV
jgi:hypothetical protein